MPIYKMDGKKDGKQKYKVRVNTVDRNGKYKQIDRIAYGKEEAKELERQLNYDVKERKISAKLTVEDLYTEYIMSKKNELREISLHKISRMADLYILPYFEKIKIDNLNTGKMQQWKIYIENCKTADNKPFSLSYKQKIYSALRSMLNYAVALEYIPNNPLSKLGNFKDVNAISTDIDFYTPDEFLKFIKVARDTASESEKLTGSIHEWNFYIFFNIAFYTGMRKGEINALKWTDIKNNTIYVTRSISQKLKGGDRETPPKNKSSIRTIQIPLPLKKVLDEHLNRCKSISRFKPDWRICGGEKCLRDTSIESHNKLYAKKAGIKKIRIHDFRHSHASLLANFGINIQEVARRLGHSKVEMTWNTYSHLYPKEEEKALEVLNKIK